MLVALLIAFLFGGGANPFLDLTKQCDKASKQAIVDPVRRDAFQAALKEIKGAIKEHEKTRDKSAKALAKVASVYASTAGEYQAVLDSQQAVNAAFQEKMIGLLRDLKAKATPEEWAAIVAKTDMKSAN